MDDKLIEKVAKAICNWQNPDNWDTIFQVHPTDSTQLHADHFRVMAKAAIQASGVMEMREALEAIIDFNNAPLEEKRPDVFILLLRKAARALSNQDTFDNQCQPGSRSKETSSV